MMNRKHLVEDQLVLINKPLNWTSFDVIKKLRSALKVKKIGHSGTLDPLATGLLLIGIGKFTKKLHELQNMDKTYTGIIEIGRTTPSFDLETDFDFFADVEEIGDKDIVNAQKYILNQKEQVPPQFSAVKIKGERAYKKARKQEFVHLNPRKRNIYSFDIYSLNAREFRFTLTCSKGTYVRSVARDFGVFLGVGAYLKKLERTHIGTYSLKEAKELNEFIASLK